MVDEEDELGREEEEVEEEKKVEEVREEELSLEMKSGPKIT